MQMTIRALMALPPDLLIAELWYGNTAQMKIGCVIPLLLKCLVEGRDVWACKFWFVCLLLAAAADNR